jgi:ribosomal protein L25 (general stress protein Ctc)
MQFVATERAKQGTGASRRLRLSGKTPGIVFGAGEALMIEIDHNALWHAVHKEAFHSSILDMEVNGQVSKVVLRDVQFHPYKKLIQHVDFQRVEANTKLHMNVPLFNGTGWGATTPSDTGWSNQLVYSTPNIGGFKANLQYQFGEQAGNNGKKNVGANFFYFGGPLTLTGFYERDQISNPGAGSYLGTTKKDWMLLGAYDFGVVKPFVSYGQAKADNNPNKAKTVQLGASVPVGPAGKVLVEWVKTDLSQTNVNRKTYTVGYDHFLSKRTDVYAMFMGDKITNQTSGTSFGVGIRHRF